MQDRPPLWRSLALGFVVGAVSLVAFLLLA